MTPKEACELQCLEESLWRSETRFDSQYMERILAAEFTEFGRSGRIYQRQDILAMPSQGAIEAALPLTSFSARLIADGVALVTYISEVRHEGIDHLANRSSLWRKSAGDWQILFHQGTPVEGGGA